MGRFLKEPLLHFLVLGALIFAVYRFVAVDSTHDEKSIVISQVQLSELAETFSRAWQHPPSTSEMEGLVQDYIHEEIAVRAAVAMGLDRDDTVIRRRLRQKLEFVNESIATQTEPTDNELRIYFQQHVDSFRAEPEISFIQVYLNPQQHGTVLVRDADQLRQRLSSQTSAVDPAAFGDVTSLEHQFVAQRPAEITQIFGEDFASAVRKLKPGQWSQPIASSYGTHLIFVTENKSAQLPKLEQIRDVVKREWLNSQRIAATNKFYAEQLKHYQVHIENNDVPTNIGRAETEHLSANNVAGAQ